MKQQFYLSTIFAASLLLLAQCKSTDPSPAEVVAEKVEIYTLKSFSWLKNDGNNICAIDLATAVLEDKPIVANDDIVSYEEGTLQMKFTDQAAKRLKALFPRTPFAIKVGDNVVFHGICTPLFMSSACEESITLDNMMYNDSTKAPLKLGHPGFQVGNPANIKDWRKDDRLLDAFRKQGKLR